MNYQEALTLLHALRSLDGRQVAVKNGSQDAVIFKPYKCDETIKLKIAMNINRLSQVQRDYQAAHEMARKEYAPDAQPTDDIELYPALNEAVNRLMAQEVEVDLKPLAWADLKISENEITNSVLSNLTGIIVEPEKGL